MDTPPWEDKNVQQRRSDIVQLFHSLEDRTSVKFNPVIAENGYILVPGMPGKYYMFPEIDRPPVGWESVFTECRKVLIDINGNLHQMGQFLPPAEFIFNAFHSVPLNKIKVVIIGQDPYPTPGHAMGLSFSVNRMQDIPGSLKNIFKEVIRCYPEIKMPEHGDISCWAKQGVLLLNACLTVGFPKQSHEQLWSRFMSPVIKAIIEANKGVTFVMWGKEAQKLGTIIGQRATQLTAAHPSNLNTRGGFHGCNHFFTINQQLVSGYRDVMLKAFSFGYYPEINQLLGTKAGVFCNLDFLMQSCRFRQILAIFNSNTPEAARLRSLPGYNDIYTNIYNGACAEIDWSVY